MHFLDHIENLIDLQQLIESESLAAICRDLLNKNLCLKEQKSNWQQRPLKRSQMHYAALNAYILTVLIDKFK